MPASDREGLRRYLTRIGAHDLGDSPPKTTFNKNEDFNSTLYSQYSTLYKTKYKTFRSKFKNTTNKFETIKGSELDDFILQKQSQYTLNMKFAEK